MRIFKGKSKRTVIFSAITVGVIVVLFAANLALSLIGGGRNWFIDTTPEGLYSLTKAMAEECAFVEELGKTDGDKCVKITFCNDPDRLISNFDTRATYYMALDLQKKYSNVEVETINVNTNPTALSKYKRTSLTKINSTDVIVSYGDRYRIVGALNFWTTDYFSYNGEYRMATLIKSVTAINQPSAYFLTDHGETYYDPQNPESEGSLNTSYFYDLLSDCGLQVKTLAISKVDAIPDDCALLIINNPRKDFVTDPDKYNSLSYVSDLEKLDRYLVNKQGAIVVTKDYDEALSLPNLEDFLHEWGFDFSTSQVRDDESSVAGSGGKNLIAVYETAEDSYANAIYGDYASLATSARTTINNAGYITNSYGEQGYRNEAGSSETVKRYAPFLKSSNKASSYFYSDLAGNYDDSKVLDSTGQFDLAALTVRQTYDSVTAEHTYSYLFCAASADFFSNESLSNAAYANYDIMTALINNISRVDVYASLELGGTSLNSSSYGGKQLVSTKLSTEDSEVFAPDASEVIKVNYGISTTEKVVYTVIVAVVPFIVLIAGAVVCIRRRFL
jgi:hypothetical protein